VREPPKRYEGTVFDREQIEKLRVMLDLETEDEAVLFASLISGSFHVYLHEVEQRRKIPDVRKAKRQLAQIATRSEDLARLLEEHPISEKLVRRRARSFEEWLAGNKDASGDVNIGRLREEDREELSKLINGLKVVSEVASFYLSSDEHFRDAVQLPRLKDAEKSAVVAHFWPKLFITWTQAGKALAGTPNGPLHKFVSLVHQACGLSDVSASTLRDAVAEWKRHRSQAEVGRDLS